MHTYVDVSGASQSVKTINLQRQAGMEVEHLAEMIAVRAPA